MKPALSPEILLQATGRLTQNTPFSSHRFRSLLFSERMNSVQYRGRLAPSPTGYLHIGHARTFWIAQQRAEAARGNLVLRNDDIDAVRAKMSFTEAMLEDMRWLGLRWQEGPDCGGPLAHTNRASGELFTRLLSRNFKPADGFTPAAVQGKMFCERSKPRMTRTKVPSIRERADQIRHLQA